MKNQSESSETIGFVRWFRQKFPDIIIFHIPNEGKRSIKMNTRLKAEGLVAGMPDLCIPQWKLFVEMKKINGKLSANQKKTIKKLELSGLSVIIGYGATDASSKILKFVSQPKSI